MNHRLNPPGWRLTKLLGLVLSPLCLQLLHSLDFSRFQWPSLADLQLFLGRNSGCYFCMDASPQMSHALKWPQGPDRSFTESPSLWMLWFSTSTLNSWNRRDRKILQSFLNKCLLYIKGIRKDVQIWTKIINSLPAVPHLNFLTAVKTSVEVTTIQQTISNFPLCKWLLRQVRDVISFSQIQHSVFFSWSYNEIEA